MTLPSVPSRELDALVAERVFGLPPRVTLYAWDDRKKRQYPTLAFVGLPGFPKGLDSNWNTWVDERGDKTNRGVHFPKPFSSDIASAFLIVEAMRAKGWVCETFSNDSTTADGHSATFWRADVSGSFTIRGPLPFAISRAALMALEIAAPSVSQPNPSGEHNT